MAGPCTSRRGANNVGWVVVHHDVGQAATLDGRVPLKRGDREQGVKLSVIALRLTQESHNAADRAPHGR